MSPEPLPDYVRTYNTPFVETELVLAAQAEDIDTIEHHLDRMLPGERVSFGRALDYLRQAMYR